PASHSPRSVCERATNARAWHCAIWTATAPGINRSLLIPERSFGRSWYHRLVPSASPDAVIAGRITMARFSLRTLGFPEIRRDDRPCQLALRKGLALLVYLAEAKGAVGRDVLATMFWPESPQEVVRARLRRLLHRLQLTLGDDVLATDRSTVQWSSTIDLQV